MQFGRKPGDAKHPSGLPVVRSVAHALSDTDVFLFLIFFELMRSNQPEPARTTAPKKLILTSELNRGTEPARLPRSLEAGPHVKSETAIIT